MRSTTTTTLSRTWTTTVVQLAAIIVGLGALALGATWYQRSSFEATTSDVERELTSVATIKVAIEGTVTTAPRVLYGFGGPGAITGNLRAYKESSDSLFAELDGVEAALDDPTALRVFRDVRESWQQADAEIRSAMSRVAAGEFAAAFAAREDPFMESVWGRYEAMDRSLDELVNHSVGQLVERTADVGRVQRLIVSAVPGVIVLALALWWLAGRRFSRRVVDPLVELRRAAVDMRKSHLDEPIELEGAATELQDLAQAINETSASLRASHAVLRDQADTDALTGLPNRRSFTEILHQALDAHDTGRVGVLFIDLDDFKVVNDSLGHAAGDELLNVVARRLESVAREGETVARLGGDEFAIVLSTDVVPNSAVTVAQRVLASLREPVMIDGTSVDVGCSIGLALGRSGSGTEAADELLRNADFAMYMANSQGKNRFEVFAPTMHAEVVARTELKHQLSHAASLGQFVLQYQPVVDLSSGSLLGFEALVRWQHPTRGVLRPGEFISLAEDTGDIVSIGKWALEEACRALAEHRRDQGDDERPLWMSVNVSPLEITRPDFVTKVSDALGRHRIASDALIIEVTESAALDDTGAIAVALGELRRRGVHVALDDFGTGYSSLRFLHELPIDVIKIDRSFVVNREADSDSLLAGIVTLGSSLGLDVIAEGIETRADLERMTRFGIAGQGYLIARPLSAADAAAFRRLGPEVGRPADLRPSSEPRQLTSTAG